MSSFIYYPDTAVGVEVEDQVMVKIPIFIVNDKGDKMLTAYIWIGHLDGLWVEVISGNMKDFKDIGNLDEYVAKKIGDDYEYFINVSFDLSAEAKKFSYDVELDEKELQDITEQIKKANIF